MKKSIICCICSVLCVLTLSGCAKAFLYMQQLAAMQQTENSTEEEYILTEENAYVFEDGTAVSLWQPSYENSHVLSYRFSDGRILMDVFLPVSIEGTYTEGLTGTKSMEPKALEAAIAYHENLGLLLDIPALLESSYQDYKQCQETGRTFEMHFVSQSSTPCVETERFTGFLTEWDSPDSGQNGEYRSLYQAVLFDRITGEIIPVMDLFTVPEDEALDLLAGFCIKNTAKNKEEIKPLLADRIQWTQTGIEICFYPGELDDKYECLVEIEYEEIEEYLHDWAIPN